MSPEARVLAWVTAGGTLIAILALIWTFVSFQKQLKYSHYSELERMYLDLVLLRITAKGVEKPPPAHVSGSKYDDYALAMWNFIEAIYDRCKDRDLKETWWPLLKVEAARHSAWFAENNSSYKLEFREWAGTVFEIESSDEWQERRYDDLTNALINLRSAAPRRTFVRMSRQPSLHRKEVKGESGRRGEAR